MDGEFIETPCQAFEVVSPMVVIAKAIPDTPKVAKDTPKMTSLKDARAVIEEGGCTIWGKLPDFPFKSHKFGLGFTAKAQKEVRRTRIGKPPLRINNHEVNAPEDWIYPTTDKGLNNWSAKDNLSVSLVTK